MRFGLFRGVLRNRVLAKNPVSAGRGRFDESSKGKSVFGKRGDRFWQVLQKEIDFWEKRRSLLATPPEGNRLPTYSPQQKPGFLKKPGFLNQYLRQNENTYKKMAKLPTRNLVFRKNQVS